MTVFSYTWTTKKGHGPLRHHSKFAKKKKKNELPVSIKPARMRDMDVDCFSESKTRFTPVVSSSLMRS